MTSTKQPPIKSTITVNCGQHNGGHSDLGHRNDLNRSLDQSLVVLVLPNCAHVLWDTVQWSSG